MSDPLLYRVLFDWKCSSTHHKLALDALRHLRCAHAEQWRNLFLSNIETYLAGSKAPDDKFKDFKNHVLHVRENFWGGAVAAAQKWYETACQAFAERRWKDAVYSSGVLSHYYSDPWQPFHTGQTETEGTVHRAAEWSIACSYLELQQILEEDRGGYPEVQVPAGEDWLKRMLHEAATTANKYYQPAIDHYNLQVGQKKPEAGYDQEGKDFLAVLLGSAVVGYARLLDRIISETGATPPNTSISLLGVLAQATVPIFQITRKMKNSRERAVVTAMFREFEQSGKVLKTLPADDRAVRQLHAEEVLKVPLAELDAQPIGPLGSAYGTGTPARIRTKPEPAVPAAPVTPVAVSPTVTATQSPAKPAKETPAVVQAPQAAAPVPPEKPIEKPAERPAPPAVPPQVVSTQKPSAVSMAKPTNAKFHLHPEDPLVEAPSIGPKTASRLEAAGLKLVQDLLDADVERVAKKLNFKEITPAVLREWQQQAQLVCDVPTLYGHDAQWLVACDVTSAAELAAADLETLWLLVEEFVHSKAGERILRDGTPPDQAEVARWIAAAQSVVPQRNAA